MLEVGDKVTYIPDYCHAFEKNAEGITTWAFAAKVRSRSKSGATEEVLEDIDEKKARKLLKEDPSKVVYKHPNIVWTGTVTAVNEDGTVNLDLPGSCSGVTLNYGNVKVDGTKPHTCCAV